VDKKQLKSTQVNSYSWSKQDIYNVIILSLGEFSDLPQTKNLNCLLI